MLLNSEINLRMSQISRVLLVNLQVVMSLFEFNSREMCLRQNLN